MLAYEDVTRGFTHVIDTQDFSDDVREREVLKHREALDEVYCHLHRSSFNDSRPTCCFLQQLPFATDVFRLKDT